VEVTICRIQLEHAQSFKDCADAAWEHAFRHCGVLAMGLLPEYRGKGLGRQLLVQCIDLAAARPGLLRIELEVRVDNRRSLHLYESVGFEVEGRKRCRMHVDGECVDTFVMARLSSR
jgi:RimJ/RimL family protein N-acetyltransferase